MTFYQLAFLVLGTAAVLVFALWACAATVAEAIRESTRHANHREACRIHAESQSALRLSLNPRAETPSVRGR